MTTEIPPGQLARTIDIVGEYTRDLYTKQRDIALQVIVDELELGTELHAACREGRRVALLRRYVARTETLSPENWFAEHLRKPATMEEAMQLARRSATRW